MQKLIITNAKALYCNAQTHRNAKADSYIKNDKLFFGVGSVK